MPPRGVGCAFAGRPAGIWAPTSGWVSGARGGCEAATEGRAGGLCWGALLMLELEGTARFSASVADMRCEIGGRVEFDAGRCGAVFTDCGGRDSDELDEGAAGGRSGAGT